MKFCEQSQTVEPDYFLAKKWLSWIYVMQGRWGLVREVTFGKMSDEEALRNPLARPLVLGDPRGFWQANLEDRLLSQSKRYSPVAIASYYAMLGDKENTLKLLEEAAAANSEELPLANPNPIFDVVRREPRFITLMKSIGIGGSDLGSAAERTGPSN